MSTKKYPLETESILWELMAGTVSNSQTINERFHEIIKREIVDTYTRSYLEASPQFEEKHIERFDELLAELEESEDDED